MKMKYGDFSPISFLTWNLYLGTDITPLLKTQSNQLSSQVTDVFRHVLATNFSLRAKAIARNIAMKKPDFIGLQEAVKWQLLYPSYQTVTIDFIQILLMELKKRGLNYEIAAYNRNVFSEFPDSYGNLIRLLDRDVILIRDQSNLKIINKEETNFKNNLIIRIPGQSFEILRGWSYVDVSRNGKVFRFLNTHLETKHEIQRLQAKEILEGPAKTHLPIVITGDLNSDANSIDSETYGIFIKSGFQDLWRNVGGKPGFTCCQHPSLMNNASTLNRRIDFILYNKDWKAIDADVIGNKQQDRTSTGLWPSDHAGVFGRLVL
jgi:endonuclease/exonuclease/phosphatase family metal-dependent hydrolase